MRRALILLAVAASVPALAAAPRARPVPVGPGVYRPIFPVSDAEREVAVPRFWLDRVPVTNADYLAFVTAEPAWQRGRIRPLQADDGYLAHWRAPDEPGARAPADAPVVRVSWFAARAYCAWRGGRLPVEREWELAAVAGERVRDASRDPARNAALLAWYQAPSPEVLGAVGRDRANAWGVHDLHGLIWEWIDDFGAALVAADDRDRGDGDRLRFCGAGAARATDVGGYAAFLRLAYRSALDARYTGGLLGFRCAYDRSEAAR